MQPVPDLIAITMKPQFLVHALTPAGINQLQDLRAPQWVVRDGVARTKDLEAYRAVVLRLPVQVVQPQETMHSGLVLRECAHIVSRAKAASVGRIQYELVRNYKKLDPEVARIGAEMVDQYEHWYRHHARAAQLAAEQAAAEAPPPVQQDPTKHLPPLINALETLFHSMDSGLMPGNAHHQNQWLLGHVRVLREILHPEENP